MGVTNGHDTPQASVNGIGAIGRVGWRRRGALDGGDGKFRIDSGTESAHLLQAVWQGVSYNRSVTQGAAAVEIQVYDALPRVSAVEIVQHMILVETDGSEIVVNETLVYQNDSLTTWNDPKGGAVKVYVPKSGGRECEGTGDGAWGGTGGEATEAGGGGGGLDIGRAGEARGDAIRFFV